MSDDLIYGGVKSSPPVSEVEVLLPKGFVPRKGYDLMEEMKTNPKALAEYVSQWELACRLDPEWKDSVK